VLLTGNTGFLGRNISKCLQDQYNITSLGRTESSDIKCDIAREIPVITRKYDLIIHCSGMAHFVPKNKVDKSLFFKVNFEGTKNLVRGLEYSNMSLPNSFIFISSVAVYGVENGINISEEEQLKGSTPYAQSKIQAEKFLLDWGKETGVNVSILRLPLICGSRPPGNLGAMIKGIQTGKYFRIGNGNVRKSLVRAVDLAQFIPKLLQYPGIYNLTDGYHPTFRELENKIAEHFNKKINSLPKNLVRVLAKFGDYSKRFPINSEKYHKITSNLTFSDKKARSKFNWNPSPVIDHIDELF